MMLYLSYKDCKQLRVQAQLELDAKADQFKNLEASLEKNLRSLETTKSKLAKNESNKVIQVNRSKYLFTFQMGVAKAIPIAVRTI